MSHSPEVPDPTAALPPTTQAGLSVASPVAEDGIVAAAVTLPQTAIAYLLQEAQIMNERVRWYLEQQEKLENLGLFSSGAVWAFVSSLKWTPAVQYLTWLPVVISAVLFTKSLLFTEALKEAFSYLAVLEDLSQVPKGMGWVHWFRLHGKKLKRRWRKSFWTLLVLGNAAAALLAPILLASR